MNELFLILGMMAVTFIGRYPVLALIGRFNMPDSIYRALSYVPVAVLTAISVPEMLLPSGDISLNPTNVHLISGVVAIFVAWFTRSLFLTIILGMSTFFAWRFLLLT